MTFETKAEDMEQHGVVTAIADEVLSAFDTILKESSDVIAQFWEAFDERANKKGIRGV